MMRRRLNMISRYSWSNLDYENAEKCICEIMPVGIFTFITSSHSSHLKFYV
jgi:hypothetical protein